MSYILRKNTDDTYTSTIFKHDNTKMYFTIDPRAGHAFLYTENGHQIDFFELERLINSSINKNMLEAMIARKLNLYENY